MKHSLLAVLVLGLGLAGCSKQAPESPAAATPPPAAAATATKAAASAEKLQADAGSETSDRAEATLEKAAAMPESGQLPGGKWKAGVHYKPIVPAQGTGVEPGQVEVLEVFWLGCSHCYALDPFLENWQKAKAPYVKFTRVPVMWGPAHRASLHGLDAGFLHGLLTVSRALGSPGEGARAHRPTRPRDHERAGTRSGGPPLRAI